MKLRLPFKLYQLCRIWRLEYAANKAKQSLEALRKFTAGHVMEHPYSMVFASLQDRLAEVQYEIVMLEVSTNWEHYAELVFEHEETKAKSKFDAIMKLRSQTSEEVISLFQEMLNVETDGLLDKWF